MNPSAASTVFVDSTLSDDQRRAMLYTGQLFVQTPRAPILAFVEFARGLIREAFSPRDPETAHFELPVADYAELLGRLKPHFIHHPDSKRHVRAILEDLGCDPELTYFDVPRLRSSTSDGYLTTGIAYAWHPHRDTWYSAPACQVNWWLPVFELSPDNAMAFHPLYWNRAVLNDSAAYNYYTWNNLHRGAAVAQLIKEDPRPLPKATESFSLEPQLRLVCPVGGLIAFSGAHMHSSVPNTSGRTRFSIDFRTVHLDDARSRRGAPRCDEQCTGTTMRDYLRCTDHERLPADVVSLYDDGTVAGGQALYQPAGA
jgi:hypothetical protein